MYYRYDDDYTEETGDPIVKLVYYCVVKETPRGVRITEDYTRGESPEEVATEWKQYRERFPALKPISSFLVIHSNTKKRAYLTREEALDSYIARKTRQIRILKHQLAGAKQRLLTANQMNKETDNK